MNKMIKNVVLIVVTAVVVFLIPLFLTHDSPTQVDVPHLNAQEIAAQKEATEQAEKQAQKEARIRRVYACQTEEDCIVVDKDPCGCAAGPQGVTAINVGQITAFNSINNQQGAKACPDVISTEKECSATAQAVCVAHTCKIRY